MLLDTRVPTIKHCVKNGVKEKTRREARSKTVNANLRPRAKPKIGLLTTCFYNSSSSLSTGRAP
jgi:hypothetical protein